MPEVVELEVAENGEIGEKDDEGVKHYHPALNDERIVCVKMRTEQREHRERSNVWYYGRLSLDTAHLRW